MRALRSIRQMGSAATYIYKATNGNWYDGSGEIMSTMETEPGAGRMEAPGARRRLLRQRTKAALP